MLTISRPKEEFESTFYHEVIPFPIGLLKEREKKQSEAALRKGLQTENWNPSRFIDDKEAQRDLAKLFNGLISDSANRACLSCERFAFANQSNVRLCSHFRPKAYQICPSLQNFTLKCVETLVQKQALVRRDGREAEGRLDAADEMVELKRKAIQQRTANYEAAVDAVLTKWAEARVLAIAEPSLYGDPERPTLSICKSCWAPLKVTTLS